MKEIGIRDAQWLSILVISPVEGEWDASIAPAQMPEGWKQIPAEQFENEYGIYLKQDDNGEPIMNPKKETYWVREQNTTAREFIESLETSVDLEKALFYLGQYTGKGNHYVSFPDANIPDDVDPVEFAEYLAEQD